MDPLKKVIENLEKYSLDELKEYRNMAEKFYKKALGHRDFWVFQNNYITDGKIRRKVSNNSIISDQIISYKDIFDKLNKHIQCLEKFK